MRWRHFSSPGSLKGTESFCMLHHMLILLNGLIYEKLNWMHSFSVSLVLTGVKPDLHVWCTCFCAFLSPPSVVFLFVGLLGSHGILCDRGQWRPGHAGCLHNLDILTGQTCHQLLAWRAARKEKLMGYSSQYSTEHWPDPVNLKGGKRNMLSWYLRGVTLSP